MFKFMFLKLPKDTKEFHWTEHIKRKMRQYQLSESRLLRILRRPQRKEKTIVPKTIGLMQLAGSKKNPHEIWLMYQEKGQKKNLISAWRYPGISPVGESIPIPEDIFEELIKEKKLFR